MMRTIFLLALVLGLLLIGCDTAETNKDPPAGPDLGSAYPEDTNIDNVFDEEDDVEPPQMPG